jgi:hypothetical protein
VPCFNYFGVEGDTSTTRFPLCWSDVTSSTTVTMAEYNEVVFRSQPDLEDIMRQLRRAQGFRPGDWQWFGTKLMDRKVGKLNRLSFDVTKSEQRSKFPRLRAKKRRPVFKPRACSGRSWMTGRPRRC